MEDNYNSDPNAKKDVKTSSTDSKDNSKTTGDSQVQDGTGVKTHDEKSYEKSDEQQEYIDNVNVNTEISNENPVHNDKGLVGYFSVTNEDDEDDDDDDNDDEQVIGDDPDETGNKTLIM